MAKAKEEITESNTATIPDPPSRESGNDPVRIHDEVQDFRNSIANRVYGTHRWRIAIPNYACYRYFECECGPNEESQARGVWMKTIGTPGSMKMDTEFVYVGKTADLGPAPTNDKVPLKQRKVSWNTKPR